AVEDDGALAEPGEIGDRAQRAPDQPLNLLSPAAALGGTGRTLAGGARQHAVLRRHPAPPLAAQPSGGAILDRGGAEHAGPAGGDQGRALGMGNRAALDPEGTEPARTAAV